MDDGNRAPARGGTLRFKVLLGVVVFVIVAWTAAWFGVASFFEHEVEKALLAANDGRRAIDCRERRIAGYPFRIELRCGDGTRLESPEVALTLGGLVGVVLVYDPWRAIVEARSPATLDRPIPGTAEWEVAHASVSFADFAVDQFRAEIQAIAFRSDVLPHPVTVDLAGLYLRPVPEKPDDVDLGVRLQNLVPVPDAPSVDLRARLLLEGAGPLLAGDSAAVERRIMDDGLPVTIDEILIESGDAKASVGGTLTVRPDGLVDGDLTVAIAAPGGKLPYLDLVSPDLARAASGILRNVLPFAPETRIGETPARSVPITIRSGRVSAGIVPLGRIPPIVVADL